MARIPTTVSMTEGPLLGVIARVALPIILSNLLNVTYLLDALAAGPGTPAHRLLCVVIDHTPLAAPADDLIQPAGSAAADSRCLQALPELTDLSDEDVEAWLEEGCRKLTAPQRRAIAADAADAAGKPPVYVYNRLDLNGFWAN